MAGDPGLIPGSGRSTGEGIGYPLQYSWASLVAHLVKHSPAMRETWVQSLGWEDRLEKGKATHSSVLAWRIPWTIYIVHGVAKSRHDWATFTSLHYVSKFAVSPFIRTSLPTPLWRKGLLKFLVSDAVISNGHPPKKVKWRSWEKLTFSFLSSLNVLSFLVIQRRRKRGPAFTGHPPWPGPAGNLVV